MSDKRTFTSVTRVQIPVGKVIAVPEICLWRAGALAPAAPSLAELRQHWWRKVLEAGIERAKREPSCGFPPSAPARIRHSSESHVTGHDARELGRDRGWWSSELREVKCVPIILCARVSMGGEHV